VWPLSHWRSARNLQFPWTSGGIIYFLAIGLGFMLAEVAMIEQQSLLLGHPIYSLSVVLAGLTLSTGVGSLTSERFRMPSWRTCRTLALAASAVVAVYAFAVLPIIHASAALVLWERVTLALALLFPCGFLMGFCFPMGIRTLRAEGYEEALPWMWALNGAASVVAAFLAVLVSMEASTITCALSGAGCYAVAAFSPVFSKKVRFFPA
jgi:predicted membrane-bound spermidine synthase